MPNRHFSKFIKGFIDPLSLIAIGFLLVSIIVAVVSVNNKQNTLNIGSKAACLEEMMCPANKCPNDYYCNKGCCIKNTSSTATTKNCLTRTCKGNSCQSSSTTISSTKTCPSSDCKVDGDCKNPNISKPPTTIPTATPITTTACIDPCVNDTDCGAKGYCYKPAGGCAVCKIQTCNPGDKQCTNGSLRECNSIGSTWNTLKPCPDGCNLEGTDCKETPISVVVPECTKLSEKSDCDQGYACLNSKCVIQTSTNYQTPLAPTSTQTKYACNSSTGACRLDSTGSYTSSSACTSSCKAPPVTGYTPEKDRLGWEPTPEDIANGPGYYAEKNCCGGFKSGFYCGTDCRYKLIDNPDTRAAYQKALQSQSNIVSEYTDDQLLSYAKDNGIKTCSDTDKACIEQAINLALNSLINNIDEITPFVKEEDKTSIINSVTEARNINKDVAYFTMGKDDTDLASEYCTDKYSNSPQLIQPIHDCIDSFDRYSLLNGIIANQKGVISEDQVVSFYNEILKSNMNNQYYGSIFLDINIRDSTAVKLWCQNNSISYDGYSQCIENKSRDDLLAGLSPEVRELYKTAYQAIKDQAVDFVTSARQIFFDVVLQKIPDRCQKIAVNSLDPGAYDECLNSQGINSEYIWKTLHSDYFKDVDPELMKTMAEQIKTDLNMNANDIRMAIKYINPKNSDQQLAEEYCKGDGMCYRYFNRDILLSLFTPEAKTEIKNLYNKNLMAYTSSVVETVIDPDLATATTVGNTYQEILDKFKGDNETVNRIRDLSTQEQEAFAVFSKDAKDSKGYWQSPNDLAITFFQVVNKQENPAAYISELSSIYKNDTDPYKTYMPRGWNSETEYNAYDIGMIHYLTNNAVIRGLTDDKGKLLSYNEISPDYKKPLEEIVKANVCMEGKVRCNPPVNLYTEFDTDYQVYDGPRGWQVPPESMYLVEAEIQEHSQYYLEELLKEKRPPSLLNAGKLNTFTINNTYLDPKIRQEALDKAEALINDAYRNDLSFYSGNFRETVVGKTKIDKDKELLDQVRNIETIYGVGNVVTNIDKYNPLYQEALESAANDYLFRTYGTESYARGGGALQAFGAGFTAGASIGSLCGPWCALGGGIGAGLAATAVTLSPIYGQATSAEIQMEKMGFSSMMGGSDLWGGVAQAMVISQGAWSSDKNTTSGDEVFGNWGGHIGRSSSEINNSFGYSTLLQSRLNMENLTFEESIAMTPLILDKWSERQVIEQSQAEANVVVNIGTSLILGGAGRSLGLAAGARSLAKSGNIVASTMTSNLVEGVAQVTAGFAINATQNSIQFSQNQGNEELLSTQGQVDLQNCRRNGGDCSLYEAKVAGDTQQAYIQTLLTQTLTDVVMNSGQGVANFIKTSTDINNAQTKLRGGLPLTRNEYDALAQIGYLPDRNNIPSISNGLVYDNAGGRLIDNDGNTVLNYNKSTGKFTDKSGKEVYNFVADLFTAETDASGNTRWRNNKNGQFASALEVGTTIVKKIGGAVADIAPKTPAVGDSGSKPPIGGVENKITPPKSTTISDNPITRAVNSIANLINNSSPIKRMSPENKTAAKASLQTKISVDSIKTVQDVKNLTKIDGLTNDEKTIVKNIDKGISDYEKAFGRPPRDYQIQDGIKGYLGIPDPNSPAESKIFTNLILMEGGGAGKTSVIMPTIAKLYAEEGQIAWISFADTRGLNDGKSQMNKVSSAFNGIDRIIFNKDTGFSTLDGKPVSNETVISMAKAKGKGFVVMSTIADLAWNNQRVSSSNSSEAIGTILSRPEGAHLIVDEPGASAGRTWSSTFTESKIADMPKSMLGGLESGNDIVKISSLAESLPSVDSFRTSVIDLVKSGASTKNMFEGTSGKGIPRDKTIIANTRKEILDTLISHFETSSVGNETERTKIVTLLKEIRSNGDQGEFLIQYDNLRKLPSTTPELNELITQLNHLDTAVVSRWNVLSMVPENQMAYNADTKTISLTSGEQFSTAHMLIALQSEGSRLLNARGIETANLISPNDLSISLKSRQINLKGVIDLFTSVTATDATPHIAAADLGLYVKGTDINPSSPTRLFTGSDQSTLLVGAVDAIPTNKAGSIVIGDTDTPFRTTERNVISNRNRKLQENGQSVEKVVRINDAGYFLETLDRDGNIIASKEIISTDPSKTETEVLFTELGPNLRNRPESVLIFFENKTRQVDLPVDPNLRWVNYLSDDLNSETLVQSTVRNRIQDKVNRAGGDTQKVANDLNAENKEKGNGIVWTKEDVEESLKYDLWLTTNKDGLTTDNVVSEVFDKNYQTEIKLKRYESELADIDSVYKNLLVELSDGKTNLGLDAETAIKVKVLIDDLLDQESRASQVRFDNILDRGSEGYDIVREYYNRAAKAQNNLVELGNKLKLAGVPESVISKMLTNLQLNKTTNIPSADEFAALWHENQLVSTTDKPISPIDKAIAYASSKSAADQLPDVYNHGDKGNIPLTEFKAGIDTALANKAKATSRPTTPRIITSVGNFFSNIIKPTKISLVDKNGLPNIPAGRDLNTGKLNLGILFSDIFGGSARYQLIQFKNKVNNWNSPYDNKTNRNTLTEMSDDLVETLKNRYGFTENDLVGFKDAASQMIFDKLAKLSDQAKNKVTVGEETSDFNVTPENIAGYVNGKPKDIIKDRFGNTLQLNEVIAKDNNLSTVFLATNENGEQVVVKFFKTSGLPIGNDYQEFVANMLSKMNSAQLNVMALHYPQDYENSVLPHYLGQIVSNGKTIGYTMEYIKGKTFGELYDSQGQSLTKLQKAQLAAALDTYHKETGEKHGDIKGSGTKYPLHSKNIIFTDNPNRPVVLIDPSPGNIDVGPFKTTPENEQSGLITILNSIPEEGIIMPEPIADQPTTTRITVAEVVNKAVAIVKEAWTQLSKIIFEAKITGEIAQNIIKEKTTNNLDNQTSPPSTNNITPVTRALISEARRAEYEAKFGKDVLDKIVQQTNPIVNKYFNDDELITDLHDYLFPGTNTKEEFQSKLKTISDLIAIIDKPSIQNKNLVGKLALQLKYLGSKNSQDILDTLFFVSDETQEYLLEILTEVEDTDVTNAVLGEAMHSNPSYTDAVINLVKFGYQNKINAKTIVKVIENCNFNEFVKSFGQNKGVPKSLSDEPAKMIENYISLVTYLNKNSYNKNFSEIVAGMIFADSYVNILLTTSSDMDVFQTSKLTDYLIKKNVNDEDVVRASTRFKKMSFGDEDESDQIISWLEDVQTFFPIESKYYSPIVYEVIKGDGVDRFKEKFEKYPLHLLTSMDELGYLSNLFSDNLFSRLESIEQQRPGISKFLRDKFGITFIDRYSEKNLIDIYDNWNSDILSGKPYGLIVYARVDQGGAFTQAEIPIEKASKNLRENGYIPIFLEVSGKQEYVNRLLKISKELGSSRKASFILILAHGTPNSFHLGKESLNSKNDNIVQISDLSSTGTEKIKKYYEVGLPFGFISCSTGVECGIAQEFATTFGSVAVGPNEPTNVKSVIPQYDSSGKIISFNIEYSNQDIAKVYRAGLLETVLNATPNQLNFASQQQPNDVAKQLTGNVISTNSFENMSSALEGFVFEDNLSEITNNKPVLLSATIFPFLSAQAMEDWSEKYIYSKYPGSKEKGITPTMFYRGVQAWLKDTRAIILNSITRPIESLITNLNKQIQKINLVRTYLLSSLITNQNKLPDKSTLTFMIAHGDDYAANALAYGINKGLIQPNDNMLEFIIEKGTRNDMQLLTNAIQNGKLTLSDNVLDVIYDYPDNENALDILHWAILNDKLTLTNEVVEIVINNDNSRAANILAQAIAFGKLSPDKNILDFIIGKGDEKITGFLAHAIAYGKLSPDKNILDFIIGKGDEGTANSLAQAITEGKLSPDKNILDFIIGKGDEYTASPLARAIAEGKLSPDKNILDFIIGKGGRYDTDILVDTIRTGKLSPDKNILDFIIGKGDEGTANSLARVISDGKLSPDKNILDFIIGKGGSSATDTLVDTIRTGKLSPDKNILDFIIGKGDEGTAANIISLISEGKGKLIPDDNVLRFIGEKGGVYVRSKLAEGIRSGTLAPYDNVLRFIIEKSDNVAAERLAEAIFLNKFKPNDDVLSFIIKEGRGSRTAGVLAGAIASGQLPPNVNLLRFIIEQDDGTNLFNLLSAMARGRLKLGDTLNIIYDYPDNANALHLLISLVTNGALLVSNEMLEYMMKNQEDVAADAFSELIAEGKLTTPNDEILKLIIDKGTINGVRDLVIAIRDGKLKTLPDSLWGHIFDLGGSIESDMLARAISLGNLTPNDNILNFIINKPSTVSALNLANAIANNKLTPSDKILNYILDIDDQHITTIIIEAVQNGKVNNVTGVSTSLLDWFRKKVEVLTLVKNSSSKLIQNNSNVIAEILISLDNPLTVFKEMEEIANYEYWPDFYKKYRIFEIVYMREVSKGRTDLLETLQNAQKPSPTLKANIKNLGRIRAIIYRDLASIAINSNERSLREYANSLSEAETILDKFEKEGINKLDSLQRSKLKKAIDRIEKLSKINNRSNSSDIEKRIATIEVKLGVRSGQTIVERLSELFLKPFGLKTFVDMLNKMDKAVSEANKRNDNPEKTLVLNKGDLLKGLDSNSLSFVLTGGIVSHEYIGNVGKSDSNQTPYDTDFYKSPADNKTVGEIISGHDYAGEVNGVNIIVKDRGQFYDSDDSKNIMSRLFDSGKYERFYSEVQGQNHYGIRTGLPSTEISAIQLGPHVTEEGKQMIMFEVANNGFYIPIYNSNNELIFSPDQYKEYAINAEKVAAILKSESFNPKDLINELSRNSYLAHLYALSSGTSQGKISTHTINVINSFEKNVAKNYTSPILSKDQLRLALAIHDIGKGLAVNAGDKKLQHEFTAKIIPFILNHFGYDTATNFNITALINQDIIGEYFSGSMPFDSAVSELTTLSTNLGFSIAEITPVLEAIYLSDAGTYSFTSIEKTNSGISYTQDSRQKLDRLYEKIDPTYLSLNLDMTKLPIIYREDYEVISGQEGSNPGLKIRLKTTKEDKYIKWTDKENSFIINETISDQFYRIMNIPVPNTYLALLGTPQGGTRLVRVAEWINSTDPRNKENPNNGFVVDAWLANFDVQYERNRLGSFRIDNGSSLLFKSLGDRQESTYQKGEVTEIKDMRPQYVGLTNQQIIEQINELVSKVDENTIREIVESSYLSNNDKEKLTDLLIARIEYLKTYAADLKLIPVEIPSVNISPTDGCSLCSTEFLPGLKEILAKMDISEESQKQVLKEARTYVTNHMNNKEGSEVKNMALMQTVDFLLAKEQAYVDDKLSLFEKIRLLNEIGQARRAVNSKNGVTQDENGTRSLNELSTYLIQEAKNVNSAKIYTFLNGITYSFERSKLAESMTKVANTIVDSVVIIWDTIAKRDLKQLSYISDNIKEVFSKDSATNTLTAINKVSIELLKKYGYRDELVSDNEMKKRSLLLNNTASTFEGAPGGYFLPTDKLIVANKDYPQLILNAIVLHEEGHAMRDFLGKSTKDYDYANTVSPNNSYAALIIGHSLEEIGNISDDTLPVLENLLETSQTETGKIQLKSSISAEKKYLYDRVQQYIKGLNLAETPNEFTIYVADRYGNQTSTQYKVVVGEGSVEFFDDNGKLFHPENVKYRTVFKIDNNIKGGAIYKPELNKWVVFELDTWGGASRGNTYANFGDALQNKPIDHKGDLILTPPQKVPNDNSETTINSTVIWDKEDRHVNFGDISVIENTENNISDEEFTQYQEGYKLFTELVNNASNPDEKTVLSSGVFFKTIMGLDSIAIFTPNEAKLLYRSLKKANSLDRFAPIIFTNGSGTESIQFIHLQKVVALLRQYQTKLGINIPDGVLSNDQIFKILDSLINSTDLKKKHIAAGLLSGFPESSVIWWVNSRSATNDLLNFSIKQLDEKTKTFLESDLPIEKFNEVDLRNYYVTPYLKYGDIQIDASTKVVGIGGLGVDFSAQYPLAQDVSTYLQKLIEIDRRLGVTSFIENIRKQISTSELKPKNTDKVLDSFTDILSYSIKEIFSIIIAFIGALAEQIREQADNALYEPSGPIMNWIFHHVGSFYETGAAVLAAGLGLTIINLISNKLFQKKLPKGFLFWLPLLIGATYISLLELDVITLWPFFPGWWLNVVPDYEDLFGVWLFPATAIAVRYGGIPFIGKLYAKIRSLFPETTTNQVNAPLELKAYEGWLPNSQIADINVRLTVDKIDISLNKAHNFLGKYAGNQPQDLEIKIVDGKFGQGSVRSSKTTTGKIIELELPNKKQVISEVRASIDPLLTSEKINSNDKNNIAKELANALTSSTALHEGVHALLDSRPGSKFTSDFEALTGFPNEEGTASTLLDEGIAYAIQGIFAPEVEPVGSIAPKAKETDDRLVKQRKLLGEKLRPIVKQYMDEGKSIDDEFFKKARELIIELQEE